MMRSLYSGVSGLKTHQTKMDVIGNNIANVNTTAYKSMSINFSELMYQTTKSAAGPNATTGTAGTNARQIGLGTQSAAITTKITTPGSTQTTGNPFDVKITGDSFFIVNDGNNTYFTRDGSFYVDAAGNLAMSSTGYNVMGWVTDDTTQEIKQDTVKPLRIMSEANMTYPAEWTTEASVAGIVDKYDKQVNSTSGKIMNLLFYDNLGYSYTAKMSVHFANEQKNDGYYYYVQVDDILDADGKSILGDAATPNFSFGTGNSQPIDVTEPYGLNGGTLTKATFKADGSVSTVAYVTFTYDDGTGSKEYTVDPAAIFGATATVGTATTDKSVASTGVAASVNITPKDGSAAIPVNGEDLFKLLYGTNISPADINTGDLNLETGAFTVSNKNVNNGATLKYDYATGKFVSVSGGADTNTTSLNLTGLGNSFTDITIDFSKSIMSDNGGTSTIGAEKGDLDGLGTGRALGNMNGVSIDPQGLIYASYDNGQTKLLGQIAVATFANPSGLEKEGDNCYSATQNSGEFDGIGVDIKGSGSGYMTSGALEMSNVDLSSEFTEMITCQRGFQANSRIITVSDTLLEELINLKR